jgi:hypothetical protein
MARSACACGGYWRDGHRGRGVIRKAEQAGDLAAADAEAVLSDHPLLTWT